jgi:putative Ca2+/H+ antiporter (TMEM165/GDT1 family)
MDWQLFGLSFITVFLAEIGDKSQLAFGSIAALILASFIGVIAGGSIAQFLPERVLKAIAAIGFATIALKLLWPNSEESESNS